MRKALPIGRPIKPRTKIAAIAISSSPHQKSFGLLIEIDMRPSAFPVAAKRLSPYRRQALDSTPVCPLNLLLVGREARRLHRRRPMRGVALLDLAQFFRRRP